MEHTLIIERTEPTTIKVTLDGKPLTPARSLKVRNHSPTGFNAGFGGSGPAQLALAIMLRLMSKEDALHTYQEFKFKYLANPAYLQLGRHEIKFTLENNQ